MHAPLTLVLGGARSGKSRHAEALVSSTGLSRVYIATAQGWDDEMAARIAQHRLDRGDNWMTVDAPLDLPDAIARHADADHAVLVDCLTLWLTNVMLAERDIPAAFGALDASLAQAAGPIVLVSNEVGLGIVPDNRLARDFRDHAGRLHQRLAQKATNVHFIAAGLPLVLKGSLS
jgi:adenosylcobinamide kinase / adenosylcobinamide-phosphate guanylyltransferase